MKNHVIIAIIAMVLVTSVVVTIVASSSVSVALAQPTNPKKVTTCHQTSSGKDNTQTTGAPAVAAHVRNQGSGVGACT